MFGPILHLELLLGSRRSRAYVFRWLYAGLLIVEVFVLVVWYGMRYITGDPDAHHTYLVQDLSRHFVQLYVGQQQILLLLAVPVLTASAVTEEKTTGTLQYFFTTELTAFDVVLGKMVARLIQVGLLALAGVPLLAFLGGLGYLEPLGAVAVLAVTVMPVVALSAASLLASVCFKKTTDAVLTLYGVGLGLYALVWGLGWYLGTNFLSVLDPNYVLTPVWEGVGSTGLQEFAWRLLLNALVWGAVTVVCLTLAVCLLRPVYLKQLEGEGRKKPRRWWRVARPAISANPVVWKERHVEGLAPVRQLKQVPTWLAVFLVSLATTAAALGLIYWDLAKRGTDQEAVRALRTFDLSALAAAASPMDATPELPNNFSWMCILAMLLLGLVVGVRCSGTITGEREKKTWEALLLTPLETDKIVGGKLWGIMGSCYVYLIAYSVPALLLSLLGGAITFACTAVWVAVTWLAMFYVGSAGLWCSVRAKSSWRSLLGTIGVGYLGGAGVFMLASPLIWIIAGVVFILIGLIVTVVNSWLGTRLSSPTAAFNPVFLSASFWVASCIILAALFVGMSLLFRHGAIKWVADRERTRFWRERPRADRGRPRRPPARRANYR